MKVNRALIWDHPFTKKDYDTESFRRWYVVRVLTGGTHQDVADLGLDVIRRYLPDLWLPAAIQDFWEWYFDLPHAHPDRPDTYYFSKRAA